jgi:hypothetical protein
VTPQALYLGFGVRKRVVKNKVRVSSQFDPWVRAKGVQNHLDAFAPDEPEGGNKIRISGYDDYRPNHLTESEPGHINPDAHIDTLLAHVQYKISVCERAGFPNQLATDLRFKFPAIWTQHDVADSQGKVRLQFKLVVETLRAPKSLSFAQFISVFGDRIRNLLRRWGGVVIVNSKQFVICQLGQTSPSFAGVLYVICINVPTQANIQSLRQKRAVDQDREQGALHEQTLKRVEPVHPKPPKGHRIAVCRCEPARWFISMDAAWAASRCNQVNDFSHGYNPMMAGIMVAPLPSCNSEKLRLLRRSLWASSGQIRPGRSMVA